jgi:hypothetical protein
LELNGLPFLLAHAGKVGALHFPTQWKVPPCSNETGGWVSEQRMSRLSLVLLTVLGLVLTAYFGEAAWRLTGGGHMDITGHIRPAAK